MAVTFKTLVLAGVVAGFAGTAQAQDFDGGYGGVFARENISGPTGVDVGFGAFGGWNMDMGNGLVAGVEGELEVDPGTPSPPFGGGVWSAATDVSAAANVRIGADAGGALVFAKAGAGYSSGLTGMFWNLGGGVDFPVMGDAFLRGEYQRQTPFTAGPPARNNIKLGVGYNF